LPAFFFGGGMNVLLINPNKTKQTRIPLGLAYISSTLKQYGHFISVFDSHFSVKHSLKKSFEKRLEEFNPEVVAITCRELECEIIKELAVIAKGLGCFVVCGGPYVSGAPLEVLEFVGVDAVCLGEGEDAMSELVDRMQNSKSFLNTKNFWFKVKGGIVRNEVRKLQEDIDGFPMPDWSVFLRESNKFEVTFLSVRGCPFGCTYCFNNMNRKLYEGKGKYVRVRSAGNLFNEVKFAVKKYNLKEVIFVDDVFTYDRKRTMEFLKKYRQQIGLPFNIITRADLIDFELLKLLKGAGCDSVAIGVESGSDFIRNKVMKKAVTKETLKRAFKDAKRAGLYTYAFNILGAPFETEKSIWETINFNKQLDSDGIQVTMLAAHKGCRLYNFVKNLNWIEGNYTKGWFDEYALRLPTITRAKLEAYHRTAGFYIRSPKALYPFIDVIRLGLEHSPNQIRRYLGWPLVRLNQLISVYNRLGFWNCLSFFVTRTVTVWGR